MVLEESAGVFGLYMIASNVANYNLGYRRDLFRYGPDSGGVFGVTQVTHHADPMQTGTGDVYGLNPSQNISAMLNWELGSNGPTVVGDDLYFSSREIGDNRMLWTANNSSSHGIEYAQSVQITAVNTSTGWKAFYINNGNLYSTDGTTVGMVHNGNGNLGQVTDFHGSALFLTSSTAPGDTGNGLDLMLNNVKVWDLHNRNGANLDLNSEMVVDGNTAYFTVGTRIGAGISAPVGYEVWSYYDSNPTDGILGTATKLSPATPYSNRPTDLTVFGGNLYFGVGSQLWTATASTTATQVTTSPTFSSTVAGIEVVGSRMYVSSDGIWKSTDGTRAYFKTVS